MYASRRPAGDSLRRLVPTLLCLALAHAGALVHADVRLPSIFGDNMVLQREMKVPVWGWAKPGETVSVTLGAHQTATRAGEDGRWRVTLGPLKVGPALTMTVKGTNELTFANVAVGDVWLCSGQSNMDVGVRSALNAAEEIRNADHPRIRLFHVGRAAAIRPADDVKGRWVPCSPETVGAFSAAGYFFGRELHRELDVPIGLIHAAVGDSSIRTWMSPRALESDPALARHVATMQRLRASFDETMATVADRPGSIPGPMRGDGGFLCNGMIAPLAGYGIKGKIWYQGEKDSGRYREYPRTFHAMLVDLRRTWGQGDFPFLFVQIATYKGWGDVQAAPDPLPNEGTWGFMREAQTKCLAEPNTAMAVSLDRADFENAHPRNKQAVGHRLALAALARVYGRDIVYSGPMYESMKVEGGAIRLRFTHVGGGLVVEGAKGKNGFAIAGADRKFAWADVRIDGETLLVSSEDVPAPVAVRYAWANFPYFGLSNKEGLPAPTFRTDEW